MSEPPKFSFGAPSSTSGTSSASTFGGTSAPSLFGSTASSAPPGGLFGNLGQSSSASKPGENKTPSFGQPAGRSAGFSFGKKPDDNNPSTASDTPKPSLFGAASTGGSTLFGNTGNTSSSPFGSSTPAPPKSSNLFGSTTPAGPPPSTSTGNAAGSGLFSGLGGQKSGTGPSLFGQPTSGTSANAPTSTANASGSGSSSAGSSLFSKPPASLNAPSSNLFSGASGSSAAGGTSASTIQPGSSSTSNLFGSVGQPSSAGQSKSEGSSNLFGGFGKTSAAPSSVATSTTASQPAPSLFVHPAQGSRTSSPFSFNQPATTSSESQQSKPPTIAPPSNYQKPTVDSPATATPTNTEPTSFLNKSNPPPSSSAPAPSLFSLGGQPTANSVPTSAAGTTSTGPSPSLFAPKAPAPAAGSTPSTSAGNPTPTPSLFAPKPSTTTTDASKSSAAPTPSLFAPKAPTTSADPAPSTSTGSAPSGTTTSNAPTQAFGTAAATSNAPTSNLNASTAGPVPPSQSRLKNKTMDEILNRWATDLLKYQKEFKSQAEQIATWDQMLVENMAKISKLYIAAANCEKETSSIEMQLTTMENQQEELSSFLDRYEKEVDDMMGQGVVGGEAGLQGVDQERERTYKLAEKLSERLEDMGNDLTSMVEDINSASAALSKQFKSDEPISQIVRILNSHLTQLQAIDQGTQALQSKITKAQKSGRDLGVGYAAAGNGNGGSYYGGDQGGAVEDFYRSYMGRR